MLAAVLGAVITSLSISMTNSTPSTSTTAFQTSQTSILTPNPILALAPSSVLSTDVKAGIGISYAALAVFIIRAIFYVFKRKKSL